jgi:hypothetical protein
MAEGFLLKAWRKLATAADNLVCARTPACRVDHLFTTPDRLQDQRSVVHSGNTGKAGGYAPATNSRTEDVLPAAYRASGRRRLDVDIARIDWLYVRRKPKVIGLQLKTHGNPIGRIRCARNPIRSNLIVQRLWNQYLVVYEQV